MMGKLSSENVQKCIIAIHDFGSRDGATQSKVMSQLKDSGFTPEEIARAAASMMGKRSD